MKSNKKNSLMSYSPVYRILKIPLLTLLSLFEHMIFHYDIGDFFSDQCGIKVRTFPLYSTQL